MEIQYFNRAEFFNHVMIEEIGTEQGSILVKEGSEPIGSIVEITDMTDFYKRVKFDENGNLLVKVITFEPVYPWILYDGIWNDSGVWFDSSIWID